MDVEDYVRGDLRFGTDRVASRGRIRHVTTVEGDALTWSDVRAWINTPDIDDSLRLLVIREAERCRQDVWRAFRRWAATTDTGFRNTIHVLATGSDRWNPKDTEDARHAVFVDPPKTRGRPLGVYVDCKPLDLDQQVRYATLKFGDRAVSQGQSSPVQLLVDRCGGELVRLRSEIEKLRYVMGAHGRALSPALVSEVVSSSPGEAFVDALLAGDRASACARAPFVGSLRFVLGALDWSLYALYLIRQALTVKRARALREIAVATGLETFVVIRFRRLARSYDQATVRRRLAALATAYRESSRGDGAPERVLIPLVARW